MELGINKIIGIISFLDGKEIGKQYVTFGSMTDTNTKETLEMVILALQNNLISRKSAMYQIKTLFIGEDVDVEMQAIESDGGGNINENRQDTTSVPDSTTDGE